MLGVYLSLVEDTVTGKLPVVLLTKVGYQTDADEVLSVTPTLVALVAVVALVAEVAVAAFPPIDKPDAVPVNPVPAPLKDVAVKTPVFGTKLNFVELVVAGLLPVLLADITGYQVKAEVVLSVIATFVAFVAVVAVVAEPADPSILVPVKLIDPDALFNATAVVPM